MGIRDHIRDAANIFTATAAETKKDLNDVIQIHAVLEGKIQARELEKKATPEERDVINLQLPKLHEENPSALDATSKELAARLGLPTHKSGIIGAITRKKKQLLLANGKAGE